MRNRWGVEVKKGHWVSGRTSRGDAVQGRVAKIERTGDYARAYGPRVILDTGESLGVDDIAQTLGPMTVGRGGVVKQNPVLREVYGTFDAYGKRRFFGPSQNEWGIANGFPFELESASIYGNAPIAFSKTRAYVCVDEDESGPVVEVWPIRNLQHPGVPNMSFKGWKRGTSRDPNPLTRVRIKSPPQRPAGNSSAPSKRLISRRKKTAKAAPGVYANPGSVKMKHSAIAADRNTNLVFEQRGKGWNQIADFRDFNKAKEYATAYANAHNKRVKIEGNFGK